MSSEERVIRIARGTIAAAQARVPWYAGDFAPARTDQISELLVRFTCRDVYLPFRSRHTAAMVLPPVGGVYPILIDQNAARADRQFALRHELAHVIAGDAEQATFLSDDGVMSKSERAADLFAFADLVPGWMLAMIRKERGSWSKVWRDVRYAVRMYAEGWDDARIDDRTRLRILLYREAGV